MVTLKKQPYLCICEARQLASHWLRFVRCIIFVLPFSCSFIWCIYITCFMIYWFIQINLRKVMIEIIFYDVMALGLPCGSDVNVYLAPNSFWDLIHALSRKGLRERVERTRVRHFSHSFVSVTCAVRTALINSSFSLFLLFFSLLILLLYIHAFIDLFVFVTCMHFVLFQVPFARLMYDNLGKRYLMCLTSKQRSWRLIVCPISWFTKL